MKVVKRTRQFCLGALMVGSAAASVAQPVSVFDLFNLARFYGVASANRVCADTSLEPRVHELQQRFDAATRQLAAAYGEERLQSTVIPILVPDYPCMNATLAHQAVDGFAGAVSDLEAALRHNGTSEPFAFHAFKQAHLARSGIRLEACNSPGLQERLGAAAAELDRLSRVYSEMLPSNSPWGSMPPIAAEPGYDCSHAEMDVRGVERSVARFRHDLNAPAGERG